MGSQIEVFDSECVGWLIEQDSTTEQEVHHEILLNTDFFVGRNPTRCAIVTNEPSASSRHLRIYCIGYGEGDESSTTIAPLVYAVDVSRNGTLLKTSCGDGNTRKLKNDRCAVLLNDKDQLYVGASTSYVFCQAQRGGVVKGMLDIGEVGFHVGDLKSRADHTFNSFDTSYSISDRLLGDGMFGKVYLAHVRASKRQVACKVVDAVDECGSVNDHKLERKSSGKVTQQLYLKRLEREVKILQALDHVCGSRLLPNIIRVEDIFRTSFHVYIFQELITAGDLFSYVEFRGGCLQDTTAAAIVRQILKAVQYLHAQGIVHRDLKPENVLMTSIDDGARVIVTDFGHARYVPKMADLTDTMVAPPPARRRMFSVAGTAGFSAPELPLAYADQRSSSGYSKAVDMFSVGAITVMLLTGETLKPGQFMNINMEPHEAAQLCTVGKRARRFIQQVLVKDEDTRLTADVALKHSWFTNRHHVEEFEALYERCTKDWRPHTGSRRGVQILSSGRNETDHEGNGSTHTSPWFDGTILGPPNESQQENQAKNSPTSKDKQSTPETSQENNANSVERRQSLTGPIKEPTPATVASTVTEISPSPSSSRPRPLQNDSSSSNDDNSTHLHSHPYPPTSTPSSKTALFNSQGRPTILLPPPGREAFYLGSPRYAPRLVEIKSRTKKGAASMSTSATTISRASVCTGPYATSATKRQRIELEGFVDDEGKGEGGDGFDFLSREGKRKRIKSATAGDGATVDDVSVGVNVVVNDSDNEDKDEDNDFNYDYDYDYDCDYDETISVDFDVDASESKIRRGFTIYDDEE